MENIDPLFVLEPIIVIGFTIGIVLYWYWRRGFRKDVLGFSLVAYGGAITAKLFFQYVTGPAFLSIFHNFLWLTGFYLGLQTVFFEVGGAFLVSQFAISRGKMREGDAVAYGLGLAFWENGVLLGAIALVNVVYYYVILSRGGPVAESLYSSLSTTQPQFFYAPDEALPTIGWGILERLSSLLVHVSWGNLCVKSASQRRREYLVLALPMGLIDVLVPFVQLLTVPVFESVVFILATGCAVVSFYVTRTDRKGSIKNGRAGEARRTIHYTQLSPHLKQCFLGYGVNDHIGQLQAGQSTSHRTSFVSSST
jgi:hypothetical protein